MGLLEVAGLIALSLGLAFLAESLVEYFVGTPLEQLGLERFMWLLMYVSAGVGVGLALYYSIDLIAALAAVAEISVPVSVVGEVLTGLIIGRGANFVHQFVSEYFPAGE